MEEHLKIVLWVGSRRRETRRHCRKDSGARPPYGYGVRLLIQRELGGASHEIELGTHSELGVDVREVAFDSSPADEQLLGDLARRSSLCSKARDLPLAPAKRGGAERRIDRPAPARAETAEPLVRPIASPERAASVQCESRLLERIEALAVSERPTVQVERTGLERAAARA